MIHHGAGCDGWHGVPLGFVFEVAVDDFLLGLVVFFESGGDWLGGFVVEFGGFLFDC